MASPERFCTGVQLGGMSASECKALWIREWGDFWQDAQPRFNYVLTWDMPTEVEAHLPSALQSVFRQGKLGIYRFAEESSAEGSSPEGKQAGAAPTGLTP
jgi:hypothetical protein